METTEKIRDLIKLLSMNQDHLCYELTSLTSKVNNFLDDRTRMLSGQLLSVMYESLMEENANESVEIGVHETIEIETHESAEIDAHETIEIETNDVLGEASPRFDDSRFALV